MSQPVPFVDLEAEWRPLKEQALARIARVFEHGQFIMGPEIGELEAGLARTAGVHHALTCCSGTVALQLALMALDIGPGDEVIVPAFTFAAPLEAALLLGASVALADIDARTYTIDVDSVAALIGPRTRAIIAVSLYGQPADFAGLNELAERHGLAVIEDAAQSFGATLDGRPSGGLARVGCTSFFPTKPLGGAGDGGALLTDDPDLTQRIRQIRDHGQAGKYEHARLGINGRLDSISCAALLLSLEHLEQRLAQRRQAARRYDALLAEAAGSGRLALPWVAASATSVYAQYAVGVSDRDSVIAALQSAGIQVAVHYPRPLHHQAAYRDRVTFRALPKAEQAARQLLCLPIFPSITPAQQQRVAAVLIEAVSDHQAPGRA